MERPFGKYTLMQRLGGGGMAEVFRAQLQGPAGFVKQLALKLILPHFSDEPEFVKMFIQEATLAARLDHANIVRIHEFDKVEGRYYIAMELVDGKDLRKIIARAREIDRPISIPEALGITLEVVRGLAFAHGELTPGSPEIVHRDISPHNIIVSRAGEVKITDFGIAKLASSAQVTKTGIIKGKAAYMSPEQARGGRVDRRSDLFSLGCVLWELLTGQRLFTGENEVAILDSLQRGAVCPPSRHNPDVSEALDMLAQRLLEWDPERRLGSAAELGRELDRLLRDEPATERTVLLTNLVGDLFAPEETSTGVFPTPPERPPEEGTTRPNEQPDSVQPIGPEPPTRAAGDDPVAETPPKGLARRAWLWSLIGAAALGGLVAMILVLRSETGGEEVGPTEGEAVRSQAPAGRSVTALAPVAPEAGQAPLADEAFEPGGGGVLPGNPEPQPPPPEPKARKRSRNGRLHLNVIPWARVFWRKKLLGETPLEAVTLPVGKHILVLVNNELGVRRKMPVQIRANQVTRRIVDLRRP